MKTFIYRGLRFLKNHRNGTLDFLVKIGDGKIHIRGVVYKRGETAFHMNFAAIMLFPHQTFHPFIYNVIIILNKITIKWF